MPHLQQRGIDVGFVDNDALVTVLTRILKAFATKEELEAVEAGGVTVDTALSSTSTNPVQNKAVKAALDGKASSSHEHAAGDITSGTLSVARGGTGKTAWFILPPERCLVSWHSPLLPEVFSDREQVAHLIGRSLRTY